MQNPINTLEQYWNYTEFKPLQEEIINSVLEGEDTFALLPTGGGKSICFQIPALIKEGICIVISPLVALMKDQVQTLNDKGIKALALTSGISYNQLDTLLDNCIYGNYKFLYLSPERLQQELVQDRIKQMHVNLIAVDEAHCISQWGNDFRPAYKNIQILRQLQPNTNVIALTASATAAVVDDIINELDFINPKVFKQSFARPNLSYEVYDENDKFYRIIRILKNDEYSAIIYVRSRKLTLEISKHLISKEISSTFYHGGLSNKEKDEHLNEWLNNQKQVMVATSAFGMGIDKPDVKTVIHFNLPESIESYFQEAGRAGRNGEMSRAIILKNKSDEQLVKNQFLNVLPNVDFVKQVYKKLCSYFQIAYGEGENFSQDFNFNAFCKTYNFNSVLSYNALQILDRTSVISLSKQFNRSTTVQFLVKGNDIFNYVDKNQSLELVIKSLLRTYGGVFDHITKINILLIANKASIDEDELIQSLKKLEQDGVIVLNQTKTDVQITFIEPREDDKTINRISKFIEQQNLLKYKQVHAVLGYIKNDNKCRSIQLLEYFGEEHLKNCGNCSVCNANTKQPANDKNLLKKQIIEILQSGDHSSRKIAETLVCSESDILNILKELLEYNIISVTNKNTYKLAHL
ncbi:ATP-dependent DNA helicase RecQ [Yeosuana sp. MJ-SS3]|uniref:ATP-dependent DNA helicase RecQ n=1 Tax=Gilvirhabdus luticola TaxID=3079858 RepID=A0ABU3U7J0_9FLAO|nr:ATP-dependent DNA helicase RecQ [Yeosuana sp. MJ-SS3]MDU8886369.1 ATP-dependent DNA helicase RecQ [Yeosuana sp. MJ-SS3]